MAIRHNRPTSWERIAVYVPLPGGLSNRRISTRSVVSIKPAHRRLAGFSLCAQHGRTLDWHEAHGRLAHRFADRLGIPMRFLLARADIGKHFPFFRKTWTTGIRKLGVAGARMRRKTREQAHRPERRAPTIFPFRCGNRYEGQCRTGRLRPASFLWS